VTLGAGRSRAAAWRLVTVVLAAGAAACGGDRFTGGTDITDTAPASFAIISGDRQASWITRRLADPLVVRVANASGAALTGVPVTWAVTSGGGTLFPSSSVTGASGTAEVLWYLGSVAGTNNNVVTATVGTLPPVTFRASAVAWRAVTVGSYHGCALTTADVAWCWGPNGHGELGVGDTVPRHTPAAVQIALAFVQLSAGAGHTCGLTAGGEAYCWGFNQKGQLGDGTTVNRGTPTRAGGTLTFTSLGAGQEHTCGLTQAGTVYCWGGNAWGQLGAGDTLVHAGVSAVGGGVQFARITAGQLHTCGLTASGAAYCWGAVAYATGPRATTPALVSGSIVFTAISAGVGHTCGVTAANAVYCWGVNDLGGLGDGTQTASPTPVAVAGGVAFSAVSAGASHSCALTPAGAAHCWGQGAFGQLGSGDWPILSTTPVAVSGGRVFTSLVAGGDHTCALVGSGLAYCWGENSIGSLGNGTNVNSAAPTLVTMP
jgi:alpha-tubulin suppressor-like RCC1 family protein